MRTRRLFPSTRYALRLTFRTNFNQDLALFLPRNLEVRRLLLALAILSFPAAAATPYKLVDPRIGTANDGQTYPVVGMPFGMTGWTPETRATEDKCASPYYYKDARIYGYR